MDNFRGVFLDKHGNFIVHIGVDWINKYIGYFCSFEDAVLARKTAEISIFGHEFDRREIDIFDEYAKIPLHGQSGRFYGWAFIDIEDLIIVKEISWTLDPRGYAAGRPSGLKNSVTLHRWIMINGKKHKAHIDHIDGDRLNNRRSNLRLCSSAENSRNRGKGKNNTSGIKGVSETPNGRWRARIMINRKEINLGHYLTKEEAKIAYDNASPIIHGDFGRTNEIEILKGQCA